MWWDRRAQRYRPNARVAVAGAGLVAIAAGIGIAAQIGAFYYHSSTAGRDLVGQERKEIAGAARSPTACEAALRAAGAGGPAVPRGWRGRSDVRGRRIGRAGALRTA